MASPALPLAPSQYDRAYMDQLNRILTQYFKAQENSLVTTARSKISGIATALANNYVSATGTAGTNNTAMTVKSITIPAGTMTQLGDRMLLQTYWTGDTGTAISGTTTVNGVTCATTLDAGAATLQLTEAWLSYTDSTHANLIAMVGGAIDTTVSAINVAGFDWGADQTLSLDQSAAANNRIIVYEMFCALFPKGVA